MGGSEIQRMCISCGFPKVSPDNDDYDTLSSPAADPFVRICPLDVKSCFYITGQYDDQTLIFRGCAEAMYEHDFGCDSDMQAVDIVDQRGASRQVDVNVNICFCNSQNCNHFISGGERGVASLACVTLAILTNIIVKTMEGMM